MKEKKYLCDLFKQYSDSKAVKYLYLLLFWIGVISFFLSFIVLDLNYKAHIVDELSSYSKYEQAYANYDQLAEAIEKEHSLSLVSISQDIKYEIFYEEGNVCVRIRPILSTFDAEATYKFSGDNFELLSVKQKYGSLQDYEKDLKVYHFFDTLILSFVITCSVLLVISVIFSFVILCSYLRKKLDMRKR